MNLLLKDKITKIEKLMNVIMDNFIKNYSYPDADARIDELPFPQLILPLKKRTHEALIELYAKIEGGDIDEIMEILEPVGAVFKDGRFIFPKLSSFIDKSLGECYVDFNKFHDYIWALELALYKGESSTFAYAVKRIYASLEINYDFNKTSCLPNDELFERYFKESTTEETLYLEYMGSASCWDIWNEFDEDLCYDFDSMHRVIPRTKTNSKNLLEKEVFYTSDKQGFLRLFDDEANTNNTVSYARKKVANYTEILEAVIKALDHKENYNIPNETILEILNVVYNRILKAAVVSTINLYTRKADAPTKKGALKEAIRKEYSIGSDRWNNCMDYYSDTIFKTEELKEIAKYIPKMKEIVEAL